MLYEELTGKIIGCCMKVHSAIGNGYPEIIYQRALAIEFRDSELEFDMERSMDVYYKGQLVGLRRVDFFVEKKVLVEIKAVSRLENRYIAQAKNYLEAYNVQVGLLINFGGSSLEFKRLNNRKVK